MAESENGASEKITPEEAARLASERRENVTMPSLPQEESGEDEVPDDGEDDGSMSIVSHLTELRERIIRSLVAIAIGSVVSYYFIDEIMAYMTLPVGKLYYLQPAEAFLSYIKIAVFAGFLLALPVIFYEIWRFVLPALTVRERLMIGLLVPSSVVLFFIGIAFAFFLVLPAAVRFFMGMSTETLMPMFTLAQYFDFTVSLVLPFGLVFELPLILVVLARMGIVSSGFMRRRRRLVIFWSFVLGALLTPPDVFTQTMIALPLISLYELSYFIVRYVLRK